MAILLSACNTKPAEADLVVLFTTDLHGAVLPYDIKLNAPAQFSLANVTTYIKQVRNENPDKVLLFDTGDFLQGQPSVYFSNYVDTTHQHLMAEAFDFLQYDAIGVGNHDIETGEDVYYKRLPSQFKMPWLCANAIDQRTQKPMFQPYAVFEREGLKVAVLGLITPHIHAWLPKTLWPNLEFEDMVESAKKWVPIIQEREEPDLLIGLFHAGGDYQMDGNTLDTPFNENGSVPAAIKVPGFDLCLLGHDHQRRIFNVENVAGDSVLIIDAQTAAKVVGRIDVHFSKQDNGSYKKTLTPQLVPMTDYAPDSAFCALSQPWIDRVNEYVDAPVGQLTDNLPGINGLFGPCQFIDLIHDAQLWATKADVSLAAVLSPHETVPAGPITMRHLFTLYKYENQLFTLSMTADEIRKYLEFGFANQFNTMTSANDHLLAFKLDENGKIVTNNFGPVLRGITFNFTSAGGIRYIVDVSKPIGGRVQLIEMSDGSPIDNEKYYSVAINSYQYSGGGNFIPVGLGWDNETLQERTINTSPVDVRRYIAQYLKEVQTVTPHLRGDWKVIPEEWWKQGKERDMSYMNGNQR